MKGNFGEPYDMAELRRALDDDHEERAAKRQAAEEEAKRKQQEAETLRLTSPLPLALKAKAHAAKTVAEPVPTSEILVQVCHCRSFHYPHFLDAHEQLESQFDWRTPEERERDEAEQRESERSLRAGDAGRRQPADRVRDQADRRPSETGRKTG